MGSPVNWATERLEQQRKTQLKEEPLPPPPITPELVAWLLTAFPPRCYEGPRSETLEDHLKYAGKVELVEQLRNELEEQQKEELEARSMAAREFDVAEDLSVDIKPNWEGL
ncbi:hypothetical protein M2322_002683 [Rhodoblastus acidophilus]|uniref:hypothetical protein n=1 Tax=Rhodoblastus acidophilus TaxID=1074 RepID=UPI0022248BA4|nr:hypothetical protein [Rhodoblastus acidophilus]MCW2317129.1 hypothetical protein [Rhodoblastus acidophilus]